VHRTGLILMLLVGMTVAAAGAEWPQFLGPNRDATSPESGLMRAWPPGGPKVLWSVEVGPGYGGAAIRDGQVFILDRKKEQADILRVLDLKTGKELWKFGYAAPGKISHCGSRSTPTVSDQYIYIIGPKGHFHCIDRQTRKVVWKKHILADYGTDEPKWAVAQSPLLYKDTVIVAPQGGKVGVAAFDQATGKVKWESGPVGPMDYASPMLRTLDGVDMVTIVNREGVSAVEAGTGKGLWQYRHPCRILVPGMTQMPGGRFFVTGGYNAGSAIIRVTKQGAGFAVRELATIDQVGSHLHPGLLHEGHIYVLCNTNERKDGFVCFDEELKIVWQTGHKPNLDKGGSIRTADGLIYIVDGRLGDLHIVQPSPQGFKSLDKVRLLGGREIWGPLALSDGYLVIRDQSQMKCVDIKPGR